MVGVEELRARDPDFETASIEDRASVMFWRKATADRLRKIDPLRKIALPDFADRYAASLQPHPNQPRNFAVDCAVGSVETLGVISEQDWDRIIVEIRWSGTIYTSSDNAAIQSSGREVWGIALYILVRRANVKTDASKSISSAHCPNCGAPESGGASDACEFCGTVLNDGQHGWVLQDILSRADQAGIDLLRQLAVNAPPAVDRPFGLGSAAGWEHLADRRAFLNRPVSLGSTVGASGRVPNFSGLLAWLIKLATVDGNMDPSEREYIATFATARGIPAVQIDSMFASAQQGNLTAPEPRDRDEAAVWLGFMAQEAWADGALNDDEWQLLCAMGVKAGLTQYEVKMIALRARRHMAGPQHGPSSPNS